MLKSVSSITNAVGALNFKGTWNASTNTPTLVSSVGVKGDYFVVGVAGSTTLNGISNWGVGDLATYNGNVWQRVEGGADLNGVNLSVSGTTTLSGLTASTALALDASKNVVSVVNSGTGNNVLSTSPTITTPRFITSINDTNDNELLKLTATASAVNELTLANAATGAAPVLSATGGDTNIGIALTPKGTGGVVFPAGAVGTPTITTSGDTNTGIYFPAADTIGFVKGGVEAMRLHPSGGGSLGSTVDPGASNFSVAGVLKANLALGSGAGFDTSGQTALIVAPSSNGLLILGSAYFLVAIAEVTSTGQNAAYILGNGNVNLLGGTSQWVATTTTPGASQFSIAYDGTNYRLYNGHLSGTFTFKAAVTKFS